MAVQRLLRQDEEVNQPVLEEGEYDNGEEGSDSSDVEEEDETAEGGSYEDLLALGRHIGDVKQERWKFRAQAVIDSLPLSTFSATHECCGQDSM